MLLNPGWRRSLGKAGRDRALRLYDENHVVDLQITRISKELAPCRSDHEGLQG
jgi:hypothetical protein